MEQCPAGAPRQSRWITIGLRESCTTLGDLLIDPELLRFIRSQGETLTLDEGRHVLAMYAGNRDALDRFLRAEHELFVRAGLPSSATDHLIQKIRDVISQPAFHDRVEIADALGPLRDYVCDSASRYDVDRGRTILGGVRDVLGGVTGLTPGGFLIV